MPKKIIAVLILTILTGLLLSSPSANAEEIIDSAVYWTYDEVFEETQNFLKERAKCNNDRECKIELEETYYLAGGKSRAATTLADTNFLITALNPENSTARVLFQDSVENWWSPEPNSQDVLKELYLYWWEDVATWAEINYFELDRPNPHEIYTHLSESEEPWLPVNREVEIKIPEESIAKLKNNQLFSFIRTKNTTVLSIRDFEGCLNAIDDREGYECRVVFPDSGGTVYHPFKIEQTISTIEQRVPTPPVEQAIATGITAEEPVESFAATVSTSNTTSPKIASSPVASPATTPAPASSSAPATSVASTNSDTPIEVPLASTREKEHNFPWWLIVFIFSGIFLIFWWFIPLPKRQKSQKNS